MLDARPAAGDPARPRDCGTPGVACRRRDLGGFYRRSEGTMVVISARAVASKRALEMARRRSQFAQQLEPKTGKAHAAVAQRARQRSTGGTTAGMFKPISAGGWAASALAFAALVSSRGGGRPGRGQHDSGSTDAPQQRQLSRSGSPAGWLPRPGFTTAPAAALHYYPPAAAPTTMPRRRLATTRRLRHTMWRGRASLQFRRPVRRPTTTTTECWTAPHADVTGESQ